MSGTVELLDIFISEVETSGNSLTSCLLANTKNSIICKNLLCLTFLLFLTFADENRR